jgi:very-short-patch-repair endonuclease
MALRKNQHNCAAARKQRRQLSLPEGLLWRELRHKPDDVKIRRQHPVGPYGIDFYCAEAKTGFEVDGIAHDMGDRTRRTAHGLAGDTRNPAYANPGEESAG